MLLQPLHLVFFPALTRKALQIPSIGQFSPQCLGLIGHIPLWVAVLTVALRYGAGPAWNAYRPIWLRRFAAEEDASPSGAPDQESGAPAKERAKSWTAWTLFLLFCNGGAAALGAIGTIAWPEHAQLLITSILPSVSQISI